MDQIWVLLILMNIALAIGMVVVSLWLIVPRGLYFFDKWKRDQNPRSLSAFIFCFFVAFSFLSFVGVWGVRKVAPLIDYFSPGYVKLIFFLVISYFLIYFSMPKTVVFYQKWVALQKIYYISLSALFAFISVFFMYLMFNLYFPVFSK